MIAHPVGGDQRAGAAGQRLGEVGGIEGLAVHQDGRDAHLRDQVPVGRRRVDERGHDRPAVPPGPVRIGHRPGRRMSTNGSLFSSRSDHNPVQVGAGPPGHHGEDAAAASAWCRRGAAAVSRSSMPSEAARATACAPLLTSSLA